VTAPQLRVRANLPATPKIPAQDSFAPWRASRKPRFRQLLPNHCPTQARPWAKKNPPFAGLSQSGRPDLNRGPHRPELWAKFWVVARNAWKSHGLVVPAPPLGFADLAVDSRGLGSEVELLPNSGFADCGRDSAGYRPPFSGACIGQIAYTSLHE
jgi:hypothetical protein